MSQNDAPVKTRPIDWAALVRKAWGPAYYEPEPVYKMPNGREYKDTDQTDHGFYNGGAE